MRGLVLMSAMSVHRNLLHVTCQCEKCLDGKLWGEMNLPVEPLCSNDCYWKMMEVKQKSAGDPYCNPEAYVRQIPGKADAHLNAGALGGRKPKMKVSDGMDQTVKPLDSQLLDEPAQEIWFLDGAIVNVVCHALIQEVKAGNNLGLAVQLSHLVRLYRSKR